MFTYYLTECCVTKYIFIIEAWHLVCSLIDNTNQGS